MALIQLRQLLELVMHDIEEKRRLAGKGGRQSSGQGETTAGGSWDQLERTKAAHGAMPLRTMFGTEKD